MKKMAMGVLVVALAACQQAREERPLQGEEGRCEVEGRWAIQEAPLGGDCELDEASPQRIVVHLHEEGSNEISLERGELVLSECSGIIDNCRVEVTCSTDTEGRHLAATYQLTFEGSRLIGGQGTITFSNEAICTADFTLSSR